MTPWIWSKIVGADYSLGERREVKVVMFLNIQEHLHLILVQKDVGSRACFIAFKLFVSSILPSV